VAELREAVDFLRYYAARAPELPTRRAAVFTCISPWNFPLAIFTGQIAAALAAGNAVLAKPAEATPLVAARATALLHEAGVPRTALQLLPGARGRDRRGAHLRSRIDGVAFTGSTATAQAIHRAMAANLAPDATLIAETGGLNAMIVDSTALPEQAVRDIIASAFQSAGQRCSALRCLYVQEDIADSFLKMLFGAMDELASAIHGTSHRYRPGDRRRRPGDMRAYIDGGGGRGAAPPPGARAAGRAFRRPLARSGARHRRARARGLRPGPPRRDLPGR
jgi:RHH-type proline utilization regulon transcriptional repressor/proline dehydrogenase/delta 1-pyrroline-5-carboxylate dehydrogenase